MKDISDHNYILLKDFLKLKSIVNSGGEAKYFLLENEVYVNGERESRRGRKLITGDTVKVRNCVYKL